MPIYEYQCAACGRVLEKWQKISEEPLTTCPACGGGLSKLISSCAFHLKGGGWYVTDYAGSRGGAAGDPSLTGKGASASPEPAMAKESESAPKSETAQKTDSPKKFK